jgi:putative inorganic carbon (hco3(-)) transporter
MSRLDGVGCRLVGHIWGPDGCLDCGQPLPDAPRVLARPEPPAIEGGGSDRWQVTSRPHRGSGSRASQLVVVSVAAGLLTVGFLTLAGRHAVLALIVAGVALSSAAFGLAGRVRLALIAVIILDIPLQLDVNLNYHPAAANLGSLGGLELSVSTVAVVALYIGWLVEVLLRPTTAPKPRMKATAPMAIYVGITAISVITAANRELAVFGIVLLVQTFLVYLYLSSTLRTVREIRFVAGLIVVALLLEAAVVVGLGAGVIRHLPEIITGTRSGGFVDRYGGTIGDPNTAGSFFATTITLSVAWFLMPARRAVRVAAAAAAGVGLVALGLTGSRGGSMSLIISLVLLSIWAVRRGWTRPRHIIAVAVVAMIFVAPVAGRVATRLTTNDRGAAASRLPLDQLAVQMIERRPILGVGVNNVGTELKRSAGPPYVGKWLYVVHNKYLLVAAEAGIAAFAAFLWFLGSTLQRARRAARRGDRLVAPLAAALGASVVGQMVGMLVGIFDSRPYIQMLAVVAASIIAIDALASRTIPGEAPLPGQSMRDRQPAAAGR